MLEPDRFCPSCAALVMVEQPPCAEGHDGDCPEWACTLCGAALLGVPGEVLPEVPVRRRPARSRTSRTRVA